MFDSFMALARRGLLFDELMMHYIVACVVGPYGHAW